MFPEEGVEWNVVSLIFKGNSVGCTCKVDVMKFIAHTSSHKGDTYVSKHCLSKFVMKFMYHIVGSCHHKIRVIYQYLNINYDYVE